MRSAFRILVIESDEELACEIEGALRGQGMQATRCPADKNAARCIEQHNPELVVAPCDFILERIEELHRRLIDENGEDIPVIIVSDTGQFDHVTRCIRDGMDWFIHKPFEVAELILLIRRVLETRSLQQSVHTLREQLALQYPFARLVAQSKAMRDTISLARRVAPKPTTVLLLGSTGTGKELIAGTIHHHSKRKQAPFLAINCTSLPEPLLASELFGHTRGAFTGAYTDKQGLLEAASGGTLFLDEIGDAPRQLQMDLLRVIQDQVVRPIGTHETRRIDVRLIAATNRDLEQAIKDGEFRKDLYFRLNVFPIRIPDLRDRKEDIPPLVQHFIMKYSQQLNSPVRRISQEALDTVLGYEWPGNVRELESAVQHAMVLATGCNILRRDLPYQVRELATVVEPKSDEAIPRLEEAERELIVRALHQTKHNKTETARLLGIDRSSLHRKMQRYGIPPHASRLKSQA